MKLSEHLSRFFDSAIRSRGRSYYWSGAVKDLTGTDSEAYARVRGSRTYEVDLELEDASLDMYCTCPYYDSSGACKHLWATILAAEAQGYLSAALSQSHIVPVFDFDDASEPDFEQLDEEWEPRPLRQTAVRPQLVKPPPKVPDWRRRLDEITEQRKHTVAPVYERWPAGRQIIYALLVEDNWSSGGLALEVLCRDAKKNGDWSKPKELRLQRRTLSELPEEIDRQILALLGGADQSYGWGGSDYYSYSSRWAVPSILASRLMPLIVGTGRCFLRHAGIIDLSRPLAWDPGEDWRFRMEMKEQDSGQWAVDGALHRSEERLGIGEPLLLLASGFLVHGNSVAPLARDAPFEWISALRKNGRIEASRQQSADLLTALLTHPLGIPVAVPESLRYEEVRVAPRPCLLVRKAKPDYRSTERLEAELAFDYQGWRVLATEPCAASYQAEQRRLVLRDRSSESSAVSQLESAGFRFTAYNYYPPRQSWEIDAKKLPGVARALVESGWHVEAEGKTFRRPGAFHLEVSSGVDWFELHGEVEYGETSAKLPELLDALRRGESLMRLGDGSYGILPKEWMAKFSAVAGMGAMHADHVRFRSNQAGLLDAMLAVHPEARCDEAFDRCREQLRSFEGVSAAEQPPGFVGQLRDYQREGLGWMLFLQRFGFGGCLADDMGVGKTAQVLALLESRRQGGSNGSDRGPLSPSLIVVPKSLVFNWKQESARFTPQLRILDYTGPERDGSALADYDAILTTYATLRRDVLKFKDVEFDYIILDEAQAIKNAGTDSAKAARLLRGRNRLAMSGTPVENHLGELWSLFEFLNPGMLGAASVFKLAGGGLRNPNEDTRLLLARALRPFILRRTKEQVARELPPKTEQTIFCELEPVQRRLYNELRTHYRGALLKRVDSQGMGRARMHVLEALLRLRQAACHPGLLDPERAKEGSAKLEILIEQLTEVLEEGHKALVFSQFTSLLRILRDRLDERKISYEYLDGQTQNRQKCVERFQDDPACRLFLISLKAGGLGLNLTAAGYVYILDPWWNPAVEAQAIDRTHRIGQTRSVFAYRLIARDTVEEKVLELQNTKRDLAAAIISADNSLIRNLQREDLELLLS